MKEQNNFFDIVVNTQKTIREMLEMEGDKVIIGGHMVLAEGDIVELNSLKVCIGILGRFRNELSSYLQELDRIDKILEILHQGEISDGTSEEAEERFNYILRLKKAIDRVVRYLNIPDILGKDAYLAIRELINLVPGIRHKGRTGIPHHPPFDFPKNPTTIKSWGPITVKVCNEYTI
ncbi:MAG: hypothetical protein WC556_13645 [Candidatus Methanoperedens sp.]